MSPKPERLTPEQAAALARRDKRRIIVMTIGVGLLAGGYLWAQIQKKKYEEAEFAETPARVEVPTERIVVPEFDMMEVLAGIDDGAPEGRLVVDPEPLNAVFDYGRLFTAQHYKALEPTVLDSTVVAQIDADPASHRVQAYRARGELLAVKQRQRSDTRPVELTGTIELEGGGYAHFVVMPGDEELETGSWVRVDGVFLQMFRREGPDGWWDGPLICGAEAQPSVAAIDLTQAIPTTALDAVEDDTLERATGLPEEAKWELMARALAEAEGIASEPVDWGAAPLLDDKTVSDTFLNGDSNRGRPFRFEILRNLDGRTEAVGENPLRIDKVTTGWIASQTWKGPAKAIHYIAPFDKPVLSTRYGDAQYVTGHGFFFKNMSYETATGNLGRVPVFVLADIEPFRPPEDKRTTMLMSGVLGATVLLSLLLYFLLMRDKRKSQALQEELVRRRRARRARREASPEGSA